MGITAEQFDGMTPRELWIFADAYQKRREYEREQRQQEIYVSALLISRFVWSKNPPSYEKVFAMQKQNTMTDDQMLSMAEALTIMFGGRDTREEVS